VLERAQREMLDFEESGMSIMEHSHRGKVYEAVHDDAIARLKRLLGLGDEFQVLFLQGGASLQFAMIPMNFLGDGSADYVVTGAWSKKALSEAKVVGKARAAADMHQDGVCTRVPKQDELSLDENARYCHLTSNNTIFGTQFHAFPDVGETPLVVDMSSDFLWQKHPMDRFAFVYAGAQKNVGPSGLVVVIAKKSFLETATVDGVPAILRYQTHTENNSLYNTPNTFAIYMVRNVCEHLEGLGGLDAMEAINREKAGMLYDAFDADADFFRCPVEKDSRSVMNVVFRLPSEDLEKKFVTEAETSGLTGLKGHRSVGGMRASIYNAVSTESVAALVDFMKKFRKNH
jgi:phosphoserine aminotransferase